MHFKSNRFQPSPLRSYRLLARMMNPWTRAAGDLNFPPGPVAALLYEDGQKISQDTFYDLHEEANSERVFDREDGQARVTMNQFIENTCLCFEVMADLEFHGAVNLLASRLIKHKYLSRERVKRRLRDTAAGFITVVRWGTTHVGHRNLRHRSC